MNAIHIIIIAGYLLGLIPFTIMYVKDEYTYGIKPLALIAVWPAAVLYRYTINKYERK